MTITIRGGALGEKRSDTYVSRNDQNAQPLRPLRPDASEGWGGVGWVLKLATTRALKLVWLAMVLQNRHFQQAPKNVEHR